MSTVKMQEGTEKEQGKSPREYRMLSNDTQMYSLLKKILNKHRDKWNYLVVFSVTGWHIVPNDRIVAVPITSTPSSSPRRMLTKHQLYIVYI